MKKITAYLIAYNEEAKIRDAVSSVLWADEVIVADSASTDRTAEIATELGARVVQIPFEGFGALRNRGRTVMLTTHYMEEAERLCDRVAIVDRGRVIAHGTPRELIASLGAEHVIEFETDGAIDPAALCSLPGVREAAEEDGATRLTVTEVHRAVPALLGELGRRGLDLTRLTTHNATLEDVFVSLTGRHLRDE